VGLFVHGGHWPFVGNLCLFATATILEIFGILVIARLRDRYCVFEL
jgi:hypothetical protein